MTSLEELEKATELLERRTELVRDVNAGIEQLQQGRGKPFEIEAIMSAVDARLAAEAHPDE
jgi:hypothetical protein